MPPATLEHLRNCELAELEDLFANAGSVTTPSGRFRGTYLAQLENPGAQAIRHRLYARVGFDLLPFGVDFDSSTWFFFNKNLRVGRFDARAGPSRWRKTEVVALHYGVSRLPRPIRRLLYDEVKPLGDSLCLGMGGINAARDRGDHFFFALERRTP